jgi:hypothetical protein
MHLGLEQKQKEKKNIPRYKYYEIDPGPQRPAKLGYSLQEALNETETHTASWSTGSIVIPTVGLR